MPGYELWDGKVQKKCNIGIHGKKNSTKLPCPTVIIVQVILPKNYRVKDKQVIQLVKLLTFIIIILNLKKSTRYSFR